MPPSIRDLRAYARFATGLPRFLRSPMSLEEARRTVAGRLARRDELFLLLLERGILANPASPYPRLFRLAGCELGDVRRMVADRGLEGALEALRDAGVYVTFEEFKGRTPIVRHGTEIPPHESSFDNPHASAYYHGESSGSTGAATRVAIDLEHIRAQRASIILGLDAHDLLRVPACQWRSVLPSLAGLNSVLGTAVAGNVIDRWFTPITAAQVRQGVKDRVLMAGVWAVGRAAGVRVPWPEPVPLDRPQLVVEHLAATVARAGRCILRGHVSTMMRVATAALEAGRDLAGVTFMGGGEPPTPAKVRVLEASGGRYFPEYWITELGVIGQGCAAPACDNDVHVYTDGVAVVQRRRPASPDGPEVDALCYTTLLATAPRLGVNIEADDYGVLEARRCGCPVEAAGFGLHVRDIASFSKLCGEGVTLLGSDMVHVLEEVLPQRFGGSPHDFQLLEEEGPDGLTRLVLLVAPRIACDGEAELVDTVLAALRRRGDAAVFASALWEQARTLSVRREEPRWSGQGKFSPLVRSRRGVGRAAVGGR